MADKDLGGNGLDHEPTWTDGLPHDFKGWGPQTPDPQEPELDDGMSFPDEDLSWRGETDARNHFVWRFDGRRHHHH